MTWSIKREDERSPRRIYFRPAKGGKGMIQARTYVIFQGDPDDAESPKLESLSLEDLREIHRVTGRMIYRETEGKGP